MILIIGATTFLGIGISKIQWLPLSFDIVLTVLIFMYLGSHLNNIVNDNHTIIKGILALIIWALTLLLCRYTESSYLELAARRYPLIIAGFITALSGTVFIAMLSKIACKGTTVVKPVLYIGRNSLWVFCVHALDYNYEFLWNCTNSGIINGIVRIILDVIITVAFLNIKEGINTYANKLNKDSYQHE